MENCFEVNGLISWNQQEIRLRKMFEAYFAEQIESILLCTNPAWKFFQIETPQLTPETLLNPEYSKKYVWETDNDLVLRPETTAGSYAVGKSILKDNNPPLVVWQTGKSFRKEQDQVTKNMRLKEFYQQEFQCIYTADTLNNYYQAVLHPVSKMIKQMINCEVRIVKSDRLPSYSQLTMDIEAQVENYAFATEKNRWMEICSISSRTDFPSKAIVQTKKGHIEKELLVLEIAIGLDRCVYCFNK